MEIGAVEIISSFALVVAVLSFILSYKTNKRTNAPSFKKNKIKVDGLVTYYKREKELCFENAIIKVPNVGGVSACVIKAEFSIIYKRCILFGEISGKNISKRITGPWNQFKLPLNKTETKEEASKSWMEKQEYRDARKRLKETFEDEMNWFVGRGIGVPTIMIKIEYVHEGYEERSEVEPYIFTDMGYVPVKKFKKFKSKTKDTSVET
jgi:hypothetical protein